MKVMKKLQMTASNKTGGKAVFVLPPTPKALKGKAPKYPKTSPATPVKAEKTAKAPKAARAAVVSAGTSREAFSAGLKAARGLDLILGDGIKAGVLAMFHYGPCVTTQACPTLKLGPTAHIVAFKATGKTRHAASGDTFPIMRGPLGEFGVKKLPNGTLVNVCENPRSGKSTYHEKVS